MNRVFRSRAFGQVKSGLSSGTGVVLATVAATNAIRVVSSAALTRLLDADAFGVVGIIASVSFVIVMVSDVGIYPFVVRHPNGADQAFLDRVWTVRLVRSVLLTVVTIAFSGALATYAGEPSLKPAIMVWALTFLLDGLSSMAFATAVREQQLARLSLFDLAGSLIQVILSVFLALFVKDYWAIVYASIATSIVKVVLSYRMFDKSTRRLRWDPSLISELWKFSRYITGSSLIGIAISQSDKFLFIRMMSLSQFGIYTIATTLASAPMAVVAPYVHKVLYPRFSKCFNENPLVLSDFFYTQIRLALPSFQFAVGCFIGIAPVLVSVLYDDRYTSVGPLVQVLALTPLLAMNTWASDQVLVATGRSAVTLAGNAVRVLWLSLGALVALMSNTPSALIVAVGTMEIPALIFFLIIRGRMGLFNARLEMIPLLAAGLGVAFGCGLARLTTLMFAEAF